MTTEPFDLLLLDVMLPGRNGLHILESLRDGGVNTPILVLTARDSVEDRIVGLNAGADDYVVKPFVFAELLARIRAIGRRAVPEETRLQVSDLSIDLLTRQVARAGELVKLTVREFQLLEYLMRNEGQVVARETLARDVWQEPARTSLLSNIIDVHVARLRRKVDCDGPLKLIHTVRGVGFMLAVDHGDRSENSSNG